MGAVYAVVNQKGGVGKTTTAVNLGAYIALSGARTLVVDLDAQSNATSGLGVDRSALVRTMYDVLIDDVSMADILTATPVKGLLCAPASIDLAGADLEMASRLSREHVLREALAAVRDRFDVILIDCPPSLGLLTVNALVAADGVIIPIQTEYYALEGIAQLMKTVDLVRRRLNPGLAIARVILTMFDNRVRLANQVVADVRAYFGSTVSETLIPRNVRLSEAPSHGLPVALYDPRSRGAMAYREIAAEVWKDGKTGTR